MTNTDLGRLLQSEEIQKALRTPKYDLFFFCLAFAVNTAYVH